MHYSEVVPFINTIEKGFPVDKWEINGYHIWPLIRIRLLFALYYHPDHPVNKVQVKQAQGQTKKTLFKKLAQKINWQNRRIKHIIDEYLIKKKLYRNFEIIIVAFPTNRIFINNYWFDRLVDPLRDYLKKKSVKCLFLELKGGMDYRLPRYKPQNIIGIEDNLDKYIQKNLHVYPEPNHLELSGYESFLNFLREELKNTDKLNFEEKELKSFLKKFNLMIQYFKGILEKNKTKITIITNYYEYRVMAFCVACHELNIKVVEIQHGLQGAYHGAYGSWSNVPAEGYEMLPDIFWCWNEDDKNSINKWAHKTIRHKAILGGNPYMEMWADKNNPLAKKYNRIIAKESSGKINILYTAWFDDLIPIEIINAINNSPDHWKWWVRIHPRLMVNLEKYQAFLNSKCDKEKFNINEASVLPLPVLLKNMDLHVTHNSSVVLEAEEEGLQSILLDKEAILIFKEQANKGIAVICDLAAQKILECISAQLKVKRSNNNRSIHLPVALDNLIKEYL